jgi:3,4-dihydroxy 2-butanone 4-phosphate synthase/GTP cyclohydrolase II
MAGDGMMQPAANMNDSPISPIEDILEDARNGKPYILVDAEDRENEGDIIIPAQFATPDQINFMARHARGLICLAITADRARQLRLPPMAAENRESMGTAFTVSIEAREGVTTGISAADRARTVQVAADPTRGADDIVSPGHVFPLVARDGGVLVRTGHTEAAVDISRMAGLTPAGVICDHRRPDRLSPPHRTLCRAGHGYAVRERPWRPLPADAVPEHHRGGRTHRPGEGQG